MFVTIINDCRDSNERGRQMTRSSILFPQANVTFMGVRNFSEIEAAGLLVDTLDASAGEEGVILVNAAPRHGSGKKWKNGTPFGFFHVGKTLVVSTIAGDTLSLVKKFDLLSDLKITDLPTVIDEMVKKGKFDKEDRDRVVRTQFRSYEYSPFLAYWLHNNEHITSEAYSLDEIPDAPKAVWWIDNFGNTKTTVLPEEVGFEPGKQLGTRFGEFTCYSRLKDVPDNESAIIIGSSGYKNKRFLEIIVQGGSASRAFNLYTGMKIIE
ncbi:hypothetical protein KC726_05860 [Candidatus Woesebacteria bacterium]|nr:hypothetical protein [Candidatus Woesebacteria bacterium]